MPVADEALYRVIAAELETGSPDAALWTRAMAEADGDPARTKASYIRLRFQALKKASLALEPLGGDRDSDRGRGELGDIRRGLVQQLALGRVHSLYPVLGLAPDATDTAIAAAIAEHKVRIAQGVAGASPEFTYAEQTLGDPAARAAYDRKLHEQLNGTPGRPLSAAARTYVEPEGLFLPWWASRKTSIVIGVVSLLAVGYMVLDFTRESGGRDVQNAAIEMQRDTVRTAADIESERVANERLAIERRTAVMEKAIDRSAEVQNRSLGIAEREAEWRRQQLEQREAARIRRLEREQEREKAWLAASRAQEREQQNRAEQQRADRERRYWSCMNAALDRVDASSAASRCAGYR